MEHRSISTIAAVCISLAFICNSHAQSPVGTRDYFVTEGAAKLSANTLSHYSLSQQCEFYIDLYNELTAPVPTDAVVVKTLVGTNHYKSDTMTAVLENLFVYSILEESRWNNYLPLAYCVLDEDKKPVTRQYILISWMTEDFDISLPAEADILLKETAMADDQKSARSSHSSLQSTRTSLTFKVGDEEITISSVGFFPDKTMSKQNDKSKAMIEKFNSSKRSLNEEILSDHYMGIRP